LKVVVTLKRVLNGIGKIECTAIFLSRILYKSMAENGVKGVKQFLPMFQMICFNFKFNCTFFRLKSSEAGGTFLRTSDRVSQDIRQTCVSASRHNKANA
jgi:hypothetical protein